MRFYDYPPSQQLRQYEPFEPNSHFYVRGKCHLDSKKYPCDFEVAYTLDGEIYVICYLGSTALHELFGIPMQNEMPWKMYAPKEERILVDFSGIDLRSGLKVRVNQAVSLQNGISLSAWLNDRAPIFVANSFELTQTDKDVLYNNPPPSDSIDFELLNVASSSIFHYTTPIEIKIGRSHVLYLKPAQQSDNKSSSVENSVLMIPRKSIPLGWSAEDIADIWCAAISVATGRDIRWIVKHTHTSRAITQNSSVAQTLLGIEVCMALLPANTTFGKMAMYWRSSQPFSTAFETGEYLSVQYAIILE
jgi:hypothetical protein